MGEVGKGGEVAGGSWGESGPAAGLEAIGRERWRRRSGRRGTGRVADGQMRSYETRSVLSLMSS